MTSANEYRTRRDKIDEQLERSGWIVKDRTKVYEEVDDITQKQNESSKQVSDLFDSIMSKAFKGELVS